MRPRLVRRAVTAAAVALIVFSSVAYASDSIDAEGDTANSKQNLIYQDPSPQQQPCSARGSAVAGAIEVTRSNSGSHYIAGEALTVAFTSPNAGIVLGYTPRSVPTGIAWDSNGDKFDIDFTTTTATSVPQGTYSVGVSVTGDSSGYSDTSTYNVTVDTSCPVSASNQAPVISSASFGATNADCRTLVALTVSFSDGDGTSWYAQIDWDYDGSTFDVDQTVDPVSPPSFAVNHTYNSPGTYTAAARVYDDDGAVSNIGTATLTVDQAYTVTFLAPFDGSSASYAVINKAKVGRVVPVKVTIYDDCALAVYTGPAAPSIMVKHATTASGSTTDGVEYYADAGAANNNDRYFRMADGFWIYNLATSGGQFPFVVGESYRVDVYVGADLATDDEWGLLATVR